MDARLLPLVAAHVPAEQTISAPSERVAAALERAGRPVDTRPLHAIGDGTAASVALLDDELSAARDRAEVVVAAARRALQPGGVLLCSARNRVHAEAAGLDLGLLRGFSASELSELLGHEGFAVELLCAPGAAAGLRGGRALRLELDQHPGLLDAAPRVVAVARAPRDADDRTRVFFAALPRKIVAAAALCRDGEGRLLVVYDSFRGHWTLPGGVVHADEDPRAAAVRETWEEAGVRVSAGRVLGVFAASHPDRIAVMYEATPVGEPPSDPKPVHGHEVGGVEWWSLHEALVRVDPETAERIRACLGAN